MYADRAWRSSLVFLSPLPFWIDESVVVQIRDVVNLSLSCYLPFIPYNWTHHSKPRALSCIRLIVIAPDCEPHYEYQNGSMMFLTDHLIKGLPMSPMFVQTVSVESNVTSISIYFSHGPEWSGSSGKQAMHDQAPKLHHTDLPWAIPTACSEWKWIAVILRCDSLDSNEDPCVGIPNGPLRGSKYCSHHARRAQMTRVHIPYQRMPIWTAKAINCYSMLVRQMRPFSQTLVQTWAAPQEYAIRRNTRNCFCLHRKQKQSLTLKSCHRHYPSSLSTSLAIHSFSLSHHSLSPFMAGKLTPTSNGGVPHAQRFHFTGHEIRQQNKMQSQRMSPMMQLSSLHHSSSSHTKFSFQIPNGAAATIQIPIAPTPNPHSLREQNSAGSSSQSLNKPLHQLVPYSQFPIRPDSRPQKFVFTGFGLAAVPPQSLPTPQTNAPTSFAPASTDAPCSEAAFHSLNPTSSSNILRQEQHPKAKACTDVIIVDQRSTGEKLDSLNGRFDSLLAQCFDEVARPQQVNCLQTSAGPSGTGNSTFHPGTAKKTSNKSKKQQRRKQPPLANRFILPKEDDRPPPSTIPHFPNELLVTVPEMKIIMDTSHLRTYHDSSSVEEQFMCTLNGCGVLFSSRTSLAIHYAAHFRLDIFNSKPGENVGADAKWRSCGWCEGFEIKVSLLTCSLSPQIAQSIAVSKLKLPDLLICCGSSRPPHPPCSTCLGTNYICDEV